MPKPIFYTGDRLLSSVDINGKRPEIYIVESNRTAGKTTYFAHYLINRFLQKGEKFVCLVRWQNELPDYTNAFFKTVHNLYFDKYDMTQKIVEKKYADIYLNDIACGYVVPINSCEYIKKRSQLFCDATSMFFDEIQTETNVYVPDELKKLNSIHTSIARAEHKMVRYVPVFMCSNSVSLLNPYYNALGITGRLNSQTKFLRGDGWVLERNFNEYASQAQQQSAFNRAFAKTCYTDFAAEGVYLNDNTAFIARPTGRGRYVATIRNNNTDFGLWQYDTDGILYCDHAVDASYPVRISASISDHCIDHTLIGGAGILKDRLRNYFVNGAFRFKDLVCKQAILKCLSCN